MCVHVVGGGLHEVQKRAEELLELGLQAVMSFLMQALGT